MPPKIKGKKIQTLEVVYQITEVIKSIKLYPQESR